LCRIGAQMREQDLVEYFIPLVKVRRLNFFLLLFAFDFSDLVLVFTLFHM